MGDIKPYSRRRLGRRWRAWALKNWLVLLVVGLGGAVMGVVVTWCITLFPATAARAYVMGFAHAALIAVLYRLVATAFFAFDREAITHVRGAWGEENTRNELTTARRRRLVWGWVDSITLQAGDIDHLVVTRGGGVVAIDSKWRNTIAASDIDAMAASAKTAANRATGLMQTLLTSDRSAKHRARVKPVNVTPLVVVWGGAQHSVPENVQRDGVHFVAGRRLRTYLAGLDNDPIDKAAGRELTKKLTEFRDTAWQSTRLNERTTVPDRR